jgi:hypothetical protein
VARFNFLFICSFASCFQREHRPYSCCSFALISVQREILCSVPLERVPRTLFRRSIYGDRRPHSPLQVLWFSCPGSVRVRALFAHIDSVCRRFFFFGFLLFLWPEILLPALNFSWPAPASHLKWKGSGDGYRSFQKKKIYWPVFFVCQAGLQWSRARTGSGTSTAHQALP